MGVVKLLSGTLKTALCHIRPVVGWKINNQKSFAFLVVDMLFYLARKFFCLIRFFSSKEGFTFIVTTCNSSSHSVSDSPSWTEYSELLGT